MTQFQRPLGSEPQTPNGTSEAGNMTPVEVHVLRPPGYLSLSPVPTAGGGPAALTRPNRGTDYGPTNPGVPLPPPNPEPLTADDDHPLTNSPEDLGFGKKTAGPNDPEDPDDEDEDGEEEAKVSDPNRR